MTEKYKHIENLIWLFSEGLSSTEQENELYAFFRSGDVPPHLEAYRAAFSFFENELAGETTQNQLQPIPAHKKPLFAKWKIAAPIAAAIVILLLIPVLNNYNSPEDLFHDSYMVKNGVKTENRELIQAQLDDIDFKMKQKEKELDGIFESIENGLEKYSDIEKMTDSPI